MAAKEEDSKLTSLSEIFSKSLQFVDKIDDSHNANEVKDEITSCEQAIGMLNALGIFSSNEDVEEVATNELKYFLFPAFLGILYENSGDADRLSILSKAKEHFADFIKLCRNYGLTTATINIKLGGDSEPAEKTASANASVDLKALSQQREDNIRRFKEKKALEEKLNTMKSELSDSSDDEVVREYYMTLIRMWINKTMEEVNAIDRELPMLQHRAAVTSGDKKDALPPVKPSQTPIQRPFIITRNDLQKQVLGLGYPSMPMYTVDEFYEQRVRDGIFPGPASQGQGHQGHGHAHGGESHSHGAEGVVESYESQRLREEREEDEKLMQQRAMDDFKDDHRRGWGNMDNKG